MKRKAVRINAGNSIAQYAIIIALVALALIPGFFMIGKSLFENFENLYKGLGGDKDYDLGSSSSPNSIVSTTPDGKLPVTSTCEGSNCTVKLGDIELKDISANFDEIIETSGTAGGTDYLASVLDQIATQSASANINADDKAKLDQLASIAYQLAAKEKDIELASKEAFQVFENCYLNKFNPAHFESLPTLTQREDYLVETFRDFTDYINYSPARGEFYASLYQIKGAPPPPVFETILTAGNTLNISDYTTGTPLRQEFDQLLAEVNASGTSIDPNLKAVINSLGQDVQMLADNMFSSFSQYTQELSTLSIEITPEMEVEMAGMGLGIAASSLMGVAQANEGLTSEKTNFNATVMDLAANDKKDADQPPANDSQEETPSNDTEESSTSVQSLSQSSSVSVSETDGAPGE